MAVRRSQNWIAQQRVDVPHMRSIESAVRNDFDELIKSFVLGEDSTYVLRGFEISMAGSIGASANSLQLIVAEGSIFHATSDVSGTFFVVPAGTDNEALNSTTNTKVEGSFTANALNYVGIEYNRQVDDATTSQVYLWNPTSKNEITKTLPLAETLDYKIVISSSSFASNVLPIAIVDTDASNNVQIIEDRRPLLFRLGTAGSSTPNPFYDYGWTNHAEGRTENFWSSSSSSSSPFRGGDKQILTLKEWMDATMSAIKELKGTTYWYSPNIGGSIVKARQDLANTIVTGRGNITHSLLTPGLMNWSEDFHLTTISSRLRFTVEANATSNDIVLADDEVAYIQLVRDELIIPNLIFTQSSATVESVGAVNWTADVLAGDFIRVAAENFTKYYKILTVDSLTQVTLTETFVETSTGAGGTQAMYAWGNYETNATPSTDRHVKVAVREDVPFDEDTYWLLVRQDNSDSTPNVYARFLGESLDLGESIAINNDIPDAVLAYTGMISDADSTPDYASAVDNYEVTSIKSVPADDITTGQYFTIYSGNDATAYYVWYNKDAGGGDPAPGGKTAIPVAITTGESAIAVSILTAAAIASANGSADFTVPVPTTDTCVVTNQTAGETTNAENVDVAGAFGISIITQGLTGTINGEQDYFSNDGDNLTVRVSKLTSMMADKAQDRTIESILRGVQNVSNVASGSDRDITFSPSNGTLTLTTPSTTGDVTITLNNTVTLGANQVAYFSVDRNSPSSIAGLNLLTVANISAVPLDENIFIFAYRLSDDDVTLWNGQDINNFQDALGVAVAETTTITLPPATGITTGQYFTINASNDTVEYYVWFNKDAGGGDPAPAGKTAVPITVTTGDADTVIATAVHAALNGLSDFGSTDNADGTITVVNAVIGATTDASNVDVGGVFAVNVDNQGFGTLLQVVADGDVYATAIKKLDEASGGLSSVVQQNVALTLIEGGSWSWTLGTTTLAWSASAQVQVAGLPDARNNIVTNSASLAVDGDVAYVSVNRTAGVPANLTVTVAQIDAISLTDDIVIIARRVGNEVLVGTDYVRLISGESIKINSTSLNEVLSFIDQIDEFDAGVVTWDGTNITVTGAFLSIAADAGAGEIAINTLGSTAVPDNSCLYVNIDRSSGSALTLTVATLSSLPASRQKLVLIRNINGNLLVK